LKRLSDLDELGNGVHGDAQRRQFSESVTKMK